MKAGKIILCAVLIFCILVMGGCKKSELNENDTEKQETENSSGNVKKTDVDTFYNTLSSTYYYNDKEDVLLLIYYQYMAFYKMNGDELSTDGGMNINGKMIFDGAFEADMDKQLILLTITDEGEKGTFGKYLWKNIKRCGSFVFEYKTESSKEYNDYEKISLTYEEEEFDFVKLR